jgi:hypothetical protein
MLRKYSDMTKVIIEKDIANLSYELFKELADEICSPISEEGMTLELQFELYKSKLIYLYNINEQCFRSINGKKESKKFDYTAEDLIKIRNAIEITQQFIKQTIHESLNKNISLALTKGLYASRFQQNN